jgi:diguanylate cyclase (GGDEF)-like protein
VVSTLSGALSQLELSRENVDFIRNTLHRGLKQLRFKNDLDDRFHTYHVNKYLTVNRLYALVGAVILILFSFADRRVVPDLFEELLLIRLIDSGLILVLVYLLARPWMIRHAQAAIIITGFILHLSILWVGILAAGTGEFHYQTGSFFPVIFVCTVLRIQYYAALPGAFLMWLSQMIAMHWLMELPSSQMTELVFLFSFVTFISLLICYRVEFESRKNFLQTLLLYHDQKHLLLAQSDLQKQSFIDSLTQIANRRLFNQKLDEEWKRCLRNQQPLTVLMIDVDNFKRYNDTFGHQQGDHCLVAVAACLRNSVHRTADLVARYGGEEFAVVLPDTGFEPARKLAMSMVAAVAGLIVENQGATGALNVTISVGLSTVVPNEKFSSAKLINEADNALYMAKRNGKNQVRWSLPG